MRSPPMASYLADSGDPPLDGDDAMLMAHIRQRSSAGHLFAGSCRMGADEASVVDPRLRVRGVGGLRHVHASIIPPLLSTAALRVGKECVRLCKVLRSPLT